MNSVLNKGLKFCPAKKGINYTQLLADLFRLERKMAWKNHFHDAYEDDETVQTEDNLKCPFKDKKERTNLPKEYPKEITDFINAVRSDLIGSAGNNRKYSNLTKDEWEALEQLNTFQKEGNIMIQPADKNSGICILNRKDYIEEASRQLNDVLKSENGDELNYYKKSNEKAVSDQYKKIKNLVQEGVDSGYFSEEFGKKLLPKEPKSSNLYLLPKVHKQFETIPKGRPIIAASGSNTERISWLLDSMAKESVKKLESYIEDTPDLLRYFEKVNDEENLPDGSKPYSIDIKSFYTNITLDEGIQAFEETLNEIPNKDLPTDYLIKLLKLVMGCNIFKFDDEFWVQLIGTSMGTRVAPTYANIFMGKLEKVLLSKCPANLKQYLHTWKRFIDDIFIIWSGSCDQFDEFFGFINSYHPTIKFDPPQHNMEENSCNFLDLKISIQNSKIETDLYRKETTKPQALLPSSAHPFRLLRICSREKIF